MSTARGNEPEPSQVDEVNARNGLLASAAAAVLIVLALLQSVPRYPPLVPEPRNRGSYMAPHDANVQYVHDHPDVQLVLAGDSITKNLRLPQYRDIWDRYFADRRVVDLGIPGDTCAQLLWRLQNGETDGLHPAVVELMIGTNDHSSGELKAHDVTVIVSWLRRQFPAAHVLLLSILPSGISEEKSMANAQANALLASRYSKTAMVTWIDLTDVFESNGQLDVSLYAEGSGSPLHPNDEGYARMEAAIEPTLCRLLGDSNHAGKASAGVPGR